MDWARFAIVVIAAGTASTITDWLITGDWIQKRFTYPEVWREKNGGNLALLVSLMPFLTCGVFAYAANHLAISSMRGAVKLAAAIWMIGPLPLILTNAVFIKLRRFFVVSYAFAWLVKLMVIAVLAGKFLH